MLLARNTQHFQLAHTTSFRTWLLNACVQIAATFGIPITRNGEAAVPAVPAPVPPKRKRDEEEMLMMAMPRAEPRMVDPAADDLYSKLIKSEPAPKGKKSKKTGRMGSRFQNQKLVKAINVSWVGPGKPCGVRCTHEPPLLLVSMPSLPRLAVVAVHRLCSPMWAWRWCVATCGLVLSVPTWAA